ncbi:hypothetical protein TCSYLVIO_002783 [Trypanosoma cruzi]|nr:hypothetical protein TCSYLVIO_002783 [Trypanosoma cruzi]
MAGFLGLFLATVELLLFFIFDLILARVLNTLKLDHPELEECAPEDLPDLDPAAIVDTLQHNLEELYDHQHRRFTGDTKEYTAFNETEVEFAPVPPPPPCNREKILHGIILVCGPAAPLFTCLQFLFPTAFGWCRFLLPVWVQYAALIPGLAAVFVFAARTAHVAQYSDVSKQQWILLMWFRLDFMCIMSVVALCGAGAWLVAGCMFAVALYLAHRVMRIEKRLAHLTHETQLVRGEVDIEHVYLPGSEQAERALASSDVQGYNALK